MKIQLVRILGTDLGYLPIGTELEIPSEMWRQLVDARYATITEDESWTYPEGWDGEQGSKETDATEPDEDV